MARPAEGGGVTGDDLVILDLRALDALAESIDADFAARTIEVFLAEADVLVATLTKALAAGDGACVRRGAHSLKSSSAAVGARALSELSRQLEATSPAPDAAETLRRSHASTRAALEHEWRRLRAV